MLRPIIMIGCGGSGQKAVRYVRNSVVRHLEHNGIQRLPRAWQFLGVDTLTTQEDATIPFLPNNDYKSVSLEFETYQELNRALETKFSLKKNPRAFADLQGWRPCPDEVTVPLKEGAGQLRAVGRSAGILALQNLISDRVKFAFTECTAGGPELVEVSRKLGVEVPPGTPVPSPLTIIVGSMAGGTGAGIMLDVVDLVRRVDTRGAFPVLVAFTSDIFGPGVMTHLMTANTTAFIAEMLSAYWDDENTDSALIPATVAVNTRGPHSTFLIGRKNIDGLDLGNSNNVYRAVGEALAAVCTSSAVQTQFNNFITVNWNTRAPGNAGGFGFNDSNFPGVASSFGSATIAIGRDRFRDYLGKLLHRWIVEHLSDGFESVAASELGEVAKSMTGPAKIAELVRRRQTEFAIACGLHESSEGSKLVSDRFVSSEIMRTRLAEVSNKIRAPFAAAAPQAGATLQRQLIAQAAQVKIAELAASDAEMRVQMREWGTEILHKVLRATSEFSGSMSYPVTLELLKTLRTQVLQLCGQMREDAKRARGAAEEAAKRAQTHLGGNQRGSLAISAGPVQETIQDLSKEVVLAWSAQVRERLIVALESVATNMLSNLEASVNQSLARVHRLTKSQDGKPAEVAGWPKNDGVVPTGFTPSPVEFYLEEHGTWPETARQMLAKSLGDTSGLPLDPVEAASRLIIRGGFGGDGSRPAVDPLVWANSASGNLEWEPTQKVQAVIADDVEVLAARIDAWMMRPNMELSNALLDDLGGYLMPTHPKTGNAIADHQDRMAKFRQILAEALSQSRPLIEIDKTMNAEVHPEQLQFELSIQGFPFGEGHPAREITSQVVQGFLNTATPVNWIFSDNEAESVLITSFLRHPVNPSVITSFTKPLDAALKEFSDGRLRASFWQWRRSRILENFVPLPDDLRRAAVRGYAVARALGTLTNVPLGRNQISNDDGVFDFPPYLLTETNETNMLPCLLEAMVLAFAAGPTRGKSAFDAYRVLIQYGLGGGLTSEFKIDGSTLRILESGDYGSTKVLDPKRAGQLTAEGNFVANAITYVTNHLVTLEKLTTKGMDARSWRTKLGNVVPTDTLSMEMLDDIKSGYVEVRTALEQISSGETSTA